MDEGVSLEPERSRVELLSLLFSVEDDDDDDDVSFSLGVLAGSEGADCVLEELP